jgi:hypothetical protein
MLRKKIDFSSCTPHAHSPRWFCDLADIASNDLGVMALLGPSGININDPSGKRLRAMPDTAGIFLAGLTNHVCATRRSLAIGIPPSGRHLPLLLAGSTVLANTLERSLMDNMSINGCVLVISPDLDLRSKYCNLFVDREALETVHAGSRMRVTGERVALRPGVNIQRSQGVCFFLPGLMLPPKINFRPALIILDLRYSRWAKRASTLAKWVTEVGREAGIVALYTLGDNDTFYELSHAGFADFPFDHSAIHACSESVIKPLFTQRELTADWRLMDLRSGLDREHEVVEIENVEALEAIFANIGTLLDEQKQKDAPDLNRARWLLATLRHLPVPLTWYEHAARSLGRSTLRSLISKLGVQGRHSSDLGAIMQSLRMQFDQLYHILNGSNLRSQALQAILPSILETIGNEPVLLIVRDNVMERAVQNWLELEAFPHTGWLNRVIIKSCSNYCNISTDTYAAVLINGIFPRRYSWIAGASLGTRITFLAYPHEVDVIEHQLQNVYGDQARIERATRRDRVMSKLLSRSVCPPNDSESTIPSLRFKRPQKKSILSEPETWNTIEDIIPISKVTERSNRTFMQGNASFIKLSVWKEDISDDESPDEDKEDTESGVHEDTVSCVRLGVRSQVFGDGILWLDGDTIIEFVRPSLPNDIQRAIPPMIRPHDILLLLNEGKRLSLFDQFVDLAEDQPEMHHLATYRRTWRDAIQRIVAAHQDKGRPNYPAILRSLQSAGASIQSEPAVRAWVQDQVIGPENIASIIAVGRVSGNELLVRQAKAFDQVFHDIRGIRQGIGRRLNSVIRKRFKHFAKQKPEMHTEDLDSRLKLPLDEILETIDLAEVITVGDHIEQIAPHRVGRIHPTK